MLAINVRIISNLYPYPCDVRMVYCGDYKINYLKLFSLDGYLMQSAELGGVIPLLVG